MTDTVIAYHTDPHIWECCDFDSLLSSWFQSMLWDLGLKNDLPLAVECSFAPVPFFLLMLQEFIMQILISVNQIKLQC
jgi:hypothetical protein